jgi:hypothetical protein
MFFIYNEDENEDKSEGEYDRRNINIINKHLFLDPLCYYAGFLLNIIPALIAYKFSKTENKKPKTSKLLKENTSSIEYIYNNPYDQYLSTKEFTKFIIVCIFFLLADLIEIIQSLIVDEDEFDDDEENDYLFVQFLIIFLVPKIISKTKYYKHQNISFLILFIIETIKTIINFIFFQKMFLYKLLIIVLNIIDAILNSICFLYIKGLMKNKFISPYKCCYIIGMINTPIIIIIYIIFSFVFPENYGLEDYDDYCLNIFKLFGDIGSSAKNIIRLITFPFTYGLLMAMLTKTINEFTLYHIYIPYLIESFINNINKFSTEKQKEQKEEKEQKQALVFIIILISSFFIELIVILVFLEIIEVKFWGMNENLKKNIELRAMTETDSILCIDDNDDDDDAERYSFKNNNSIY